jgi:hypothetical protein
MRIHSLDAALKLCHSLFDGADDAKVTRCVGQAAKVFQSVADTVKCGRLQARVRPEVSIG